MLNANLVEATKSASAVFAVALQKPFYIDPVTYAFALDPRLLLSANRKRDKPPQPKSTFSALAAAFRLPLERVGFQYLRPDAISGPTRTQIVEAVLDYQQNVLTNALSSDAAFIPATMTGRAIPAGLVAPYFVNDGTDDWLNTNIAMLREAQDMSGDQCVAMLALDTRAVPPSSMPAIADTYVSVGVTRYFVWPTDLDEHSSSRELLSAYADMVRVLSQAGGTPHAAFSGFFGMLLAFRGLAGITHGLTYGDKRDLEPVVGGGLPPARFYVRAVRDTIAMGDLPVLLDGATEAEFLRFVCDCPICRGLLDRGGLQHLVQEFTDTETRITAIRGLTEVPTPRVYQMSRFHYLANRHREVQEIAAAQSFEDVRRETSMLAAWAAERLGARAVSHIPRWFEAADPARL